MRETNFETKRARPVLVVILILLLLLGAGLNIWLWHGIAARQRHSAAVNARHQISDNDLTKFGLPIAHELIGPYHVLRNIGYVSGYDAGIQDPRWVETRFFAVQNPQSAARPDSFSPDDRIEPQFRVTTDYWRDTGYDRGHMAPNWGVSICYGRSAQVESFLLTNVIPQSPELNRGLWETLEKIISNDYAQRFGQIWVVCGPEFSAHPATLHGDLIEIPDRCFKIVLRVDPDGTPHTLAFEMPQNIVMGHRQGDLLQYLVPIAQIEKDTGIGFFPELPESTRAAQTEGRATRMW